MHDHRSKTRGLGAAARRRPYAATADAAVTAQRDLAEVDWPKDARVRCESEQDITSISAGLHDAASIAVVDGDLELGARLTGAAQRIVDETSAQPPPSLVNRVEALPALRQQLDAERLERLLAEGSEMSIDEAVARPIGLK